MLVDRLCDEPGGMAECLEQLWEALGIKQLASSSSYKKPQPTAARLNPPHAVGGGSDIIPAEASAALGLVLQLSSHYSSPAMASLSLRRGEGAVGGASASQALNAAATSISSPLQELWRQVRQIMQPLN